MRHLCLSWPLRLLLLVSALILSSSCSRPDSDKVRVGVIAEITGDMPAVGASCTNAARMAVDEQNAAGGVAIKSMRSKIELLIEDNAGRPEQAVAVAQKLISEGGITAIVGPNSSRYAIPVTEIAEGAKIPMISPWATNPKATLDARSGKPKKYVFRACFTDPFQGPVVARFARENLKARKAAVLYDVASDYNKGIAEYFRKAFEELGGAVPAYEAYSTGDKDFSAQLTKIKDIEPDVIFLPNYYSEVPLQIQQAKRLGLAGVPFIGSDSWGSQELLKLCGADCEGYFFTTHYAADRPSPEAAQFISGYQARFGSAPDDVAALTYDSFKLLFRAMEEAGSSDREQIRTALAGIKDFPGVTGRLQYEQTGDPVKSAVVIQIKNGRFTWYADARP